MTTDTVLKKSSELAQGDIVLTHGLRVQLDRPVTEYPRHSSNGLSAFASRGLVLNIDELEDAWLESFVRSDRRDEDGEGVRWTIQANDLVKWEVEA